MFDAEEILKPLPLPGPGDSFFPPADHISGAAIIGEQFFEWQKYATGYRDAADFLVDHAIERGSMQDWLVFPILALYRQSIELELKLFIRACIALDGPRGVWSARPEQSRNCLEGHFLVPLWDETLILMSALEPAIEVDESITHAGRLIAELADMDPDATRFRYPTKKDKKKRKAEDHFPKSEQPSLPTRRVDLHHAKLMVEKIGHVLGQMYECALQQAAFESEMRAEYGP